MSQTFRLLLFASSLLVVYYIEAKILNRLSYFRDKRWHGCHDVKKYPHKESFFGLDLLIKDTKEHTKSVYLAEFKRQYALYGKTHEIRFLNARMIRTMEPKNMQAILGLNAKDFGLQPFREGLAMPLFDHEINTTDDEYWQYSRSLINSTFFRVEICNLGSFEFHFGRFLDLIPRDRSEFDLQSLLSRLALKTERLRKTGGQLEQREADRHLLLNEMVKQTQDKLDLRSQILAVFMPSRDITAFLVSNVFHVLARRPNIWAKLRKEILSFGPQFLTFELLKSMKYLQWVINENHRMYSISDNNPRVVLNDFVLLTDGGLSGKSPILVRKDEYISFNLYCLHQDKDIWGADADEFRPER